MSKRRNRRLIEKTDINLNNFKVYRINKDNSIVYRCKYCHLSRIKIEKNMIIKISGHMRNCIGLNNSKIINNKNLNDLYKTDERTKNSSNTKIKLDDESINDIKIKNNNINFFENNSSLSTNVPKSDYFEKNVEDQKKIFQLLINVYDKTNNLNKYQEEIGAYYINKKKLLGKGAFSEVFLGEDIFHRMNVAILQINKENEYNFIIEDFVLQRIHGKGNFPQLYHTYMDEKYVYMVECLMGPNLHLLHKLCNYKFEYYTVVNIALDLLKNIRILHELGFIHRDLKPDNLVFGNLCFENAEKRNEIGIIDFSNSKINMKSNGSYNFCDKKVGCQGNKSFSSTNALKDKDVREKDDLISIFYILLYFLKGELPWKTENLRGKHLSKNKIIEIRENLSLKKLCEDIPHEFYKLIEFIFEMPEEEKIDYDFIIESLENIKSIEEMRQINKREKFVWIEILNKYLENAKDLNKNKRVQIKEILDKYCIRLRDYLTYIKS